MEKTSLIVGIVVIVVVIAAAYMGTQPAAPPTTAPTTTAPTTVTATATATTTAPPTATHEITPTATTPAAEPLKVAAIHMDPTVTSTSWDLPQYEGMLRMQEKYGLTYEFSEGVFTPDGERVGRSYAERGFDILLYTSWYPDAIKSISSDLPDIIVLGAGGGTELHVLYPPPEEVPPNVGHYDSGLHETSYLCGYLAGKLTETNIIGIVGQYPVLNANAYLNGFILGAKDANPDVGLSISWVYSWFDPVAAKEHAIAAVEAGADIILSDATGSWEGANEQGVYYIHPQQDRPALEFVPEVMVASSNWILDPTYDTIITSVMEGRFEAREYYLGLAAGGAEFKIHLPDALTSDTIDELKVLEDRIINGEFIIPRITAVPEEYWGL